MRPKKTQEDAERALMEELRDALYIADEFIRSVTAWTGHKDDQTDALGAVEDALREGDMT